MSTTKTVKTPEPLITRKQAAEEVLHVKPQTLAKWASEGRYGIPYVKVGRLAMYRRSDLERWMLSRTVTSTAANTAAGVPASA